MIAEECLKREEKDEKKPINQLLQEIMEDLKNLRQKIAENSQLRRELIEFSFKSGA
jgi:hypothetical protein